MTRQVLTLCLVHDHSRILLGMKKRGMGAGLSAEKQGFGMGKWNGFGGKVEQGETLEEAARREVFEEAGIQAIDLEKMGEIEIEFVNDPQILKVHIFKVASFTGKPVESDEMKPQWFNVDEIPFDQMWPDDKYWLPVFLRGKKFKAKFVLQGQDNIIDQKLEILDA